MSEMTSAEGTPLLRVRDLHVHIDTRNGRVKAVNGVDLDLRRGRTLGIVGESGSGKTMLIRAVMGLLRRRAISVRGEVVLDGQEITRLNARESRRIRGPKIAMVYQDPMTSLNPVMKIGVQLTEGMRHHLGVSRQQSRELAIELLRSVGITSPERRFNQYPFELSGGMRQRVTIAIALACNPNLLIADEPTTALDVTIQAQVLRLLDVAKREREMAMILVTHDLSIVAGHADDIIVMYAGRIVERSPAADLFRNTRMPYTQALLDSVPNLDEPAHTPLVTIGGRPPNPMDASSGCSFAPRCAYAQDKCREEEPVLRTDDTVAAGHEFACWFPLGEGNGIPAGASPPQAVAHEGVGAHD